MKQKWLPGFVAALVLLSAAPTMAHHSAAAFDRTKSIIITGSVIRYAWQNPHVFIYVAVPDGKGGMQEWALEAGSVSIMSRSGWRKDTLKPGDQIRAVTAPYRDGSTRGEVMSLRRGDGRVLSYGSI